MGLFRRRVNRVADPRPAITQFWSWWAGHRGDVVKAVDEHRIDDALRMLQEPVTTIDARLNWEITGGRDKKFGLVVSGAGELDLRSVAERWVLAAPDDPEVEFISSRRRDPEFLASGVQKVDDYDFAMSELVAGVRADASAGKVHVVVHHPLFTLIDHDHRLHVAFLGLDAALGEEGVQRWIGSIEVSVDLPIDAIQLGSLYDVVEQLRAPGGGEWAAMEGRGPRGPVFAIVRRAASRYTHPLVDTHVAVVLGYDAEGNGMPADTSISAEVEELESTIMAAFGGDGPHAVHVGHITGGGHVVAHFYVDGLEVQPEVARPLLDTWSRGKATLATAHDPGWEHVAAFMG
ncbi:hypothetical protein G1H11_10795 [Phytoactinopolyspora alkaliphila]|uniref:DUF695 domain-containing protein n=1 Tax=Phytoactinopolyspora alkaliphila TaxID=1783498 RepID=A0A6N9YLK1_9ACTN|nr:hypothetical protein [Phytoactinopolyspora alkaliphila]NED95800.1 hypothetical protein [Phytoactinopolyspora alkaliphila]